MLENYIATGLLNLLALGVLAYIVCVTRLQAPQVRSSYLWAIGLTAVILTAELVTYLLQYHQPSALVLFLHTLVNILGFGISPFLPLLLLKVLSRGNFKLNLWHLLPGFLQGFLVLTSPLTGFIFSISSANVYQRGPLFSCYFAAYMWGVLLFCFYACKQALQYSFSIRAMYAILILFLIVGTLIQVLWPPLHTSWSCVTLALILYYACNGELNSRHDSLTGIFNRAAYESELIRLKKHRYVAVYLFDIDCFKNANDLLGHGYGDYCLKTMARELNSAFSGLGHCYRIGGDELCVLSFRNNPDAGRLAIARLLQRLSDLRRQDPNLPTLSYGLAEGSGAEILKIVQEADQQMYQYKEIAHQRQSPLKDSSL